MAAHALLSASSSKRWINCPPSARLEEPIPNKSSVFSEEGTFAHSFSETLLKQFIGPDNMTTYKRTLKKDKYYSAELEEHCTTYTDYVKEKIMEARALTPDAVVLLEQKLDFSPWVPDGFGTGDVVIIADGVMDVIDLKYGQGVSVSAEYNPQLMLYGLGALNNFGMLYDIDLIRLTIHQVRKEGPSTFEISAEELLAWGETEVKPAAEIAFKGEGEQAAGDWCKFCRVNATCRKRAETNLELARLEFKKPPLLTVEEVGEVLAQAKLIQDWAADIHEFALDAAVNHGMKFPGWKVVEGTSRRVIDDKEGIAADLELSGFTAEQIFKPQELFGLGDLEKLVGKKKFSENYAAYVIKPPGKPVLVAETDKRSEINSVASAQEDFANSPLFGGGQK